MQQQAATTEQIIPASNFWDGFITETEAADYLCQSIRTLQKWRVTGFDPHFYKPGRSVRYRRRDLREWLKRVVAATHLNNPVLPVWGWQHHAGFWGRKVSTTGARYRTSRLSFACHHQPHTGNRTHEPTSTQDKNRAHIWGLMRKTRAKKQTYKMPRTAPIKLPTVRCNWGLKHTVGLILP